MDLYGDTNLPHIRHELSMDPDRQFQLYNTRFFFTGESVPETYSHLTEEDVLNLVIGGINALEEHGSATIKKQARALLTALTERT